MKTRSQSAGNSTKKVKTPVRGKAKSGRVEKSPKERASTMIKSKAKTGKDAAEKLRAEKARTKSLSVNLKQEINGEHEAKKEREAANRLRKSEQVKKAEIVQQVRDSPKARRTKRKAARKSVANAKATGSGDQTKRILRSSR